MVLGSTHDDVVDFSATDESIVGFHLWKPLAVQAVVGRQDLTILVSSKRFLGWKLREIAVDGKSGITGRHDLWWHHEPLRLSDAVVVAISGETAGQGSWRSLEAEQFTGLKDGSACVREIAANSSFCIVPHEDGLKGAIRVELVSEAQRRISALRLT